MDKKFGEGIWAKSLNSILTFAACDDVRLCNLCCLVDNYLFVEGLGPGSPGKKGKGLPYPTRNVHVGSSPFPRR